MKKKPIAHGAWTEPVGVVGKAGPKKRGKLASINACAGVLLEVEMFKSEERASVA